MEDKNKPTWQELEEAYIARIKSEIWQPETEESRKVVEERLKKVEEYRKKRLRR
ncbi:MULTISPECIES: histidine kinase [Aerococcus]|uniref:Histidine kinase n=1 Tax=Aerococcus urinae TaxID=1376 RepID=A0A329NZW1_9LACT|nr:MULTISPECIES: histidine kinase [Aerococcus]MDK6729053.1 histidine kinase [Aerococcus urinae]RAV81456.1 histidine kinase [Aerococcus loyolae]